MTHEGKGLLLCRLHVYNDPLMLEVFVIEALIVYNSILQSQVMKGNRITPHRLCYNLLCDRLLDFPCVPAINSTEA